ncbi:hypothetical protein JTB14_008278 [Gonioctena quinquepunctata]|nr:hypothetical protein JTB14_008278 [Gonioctena quinquepunctata]
MVHETRYDARISAIRRVETREEVPYRTKGRGEAMGNRSETGAYQRNNRREGRNLQRGPRVMERIDSPTCEPAACVAVKKDTERSTLFFKLPAPERPAQQLRSSNFPQHVVICHINPSHSKFIDLFSTRTATTWLLDTGVSVSSIKKKLVKELNLPIHRGSTSIISDISGNVLSKEGSVEVTSQLPRESIEHECIVCDDGLSFPSDGLLGGDFLNKFRPTLDSQKNLLILHGYSLVMSDDHLIPSHRTIDTNSPVMRKVPIDVEIRQLFSVGKQMCDNVEWYSGFTELNINNIILGNLTSVNCVLGQRILHHKQIWGP